MDGRMKRLVAILILTLSFIQVLTGKAFSQKDESFIRKSIIGNRTVTCSGETFGSAYPQRMYTCANMRVDNEVLLHGYFSAYLIQEEEGCSDCPCGRISKHPNDITRLCQELLEKSNVEYPLVAAYVIKPNCSFTSPEKRFSYIYENGVYRWKSADMENGYITTLQCLTTGQ